MRALLGSLDDAQQERAVISPEAPADILTSNARKAAAQAQNGIAYAELSAEQRGLLLAVIEEYAGVRPEAVARERVERIREAGFDGIRFAWMGGANRGERHYYRIQGPTFPHRVRQYRVDLLEEHYRHSSHHQQ